MSCIAAINVPVTARVVSRDQAPRTWATRSSGALTSVTRAPAGLRAAAFRPALRSRGLSVTANAAPPAPTGDALPPPATFNVRRVSVRISRYPNNEAY